MEREPLSITLARLGASVVWDVDSFRNGLLNRKNKQMLKFHLEGTDCAHVRCKKLREIALPRILNKNLFDGVHAGQKCFSCNNERSKH